MVTPTVFPKNNLPPGQNSLDHVASAEFNCVVKGTAAVLVDHHLDLVLFVLNHVKDRLVPSLLKSFVLTIHFFGEGLLVGRFVEGEEVADVVVHLNVIVVDAEVKQCVAVPVLEIETGLVFDQQPNNLLSFRALEADSKGDGVISKVDGAVFALGEELSPDSRVGAIS